MGFLVTIDTTLIGDESVYIAVIFFCQRQWLLFVYACSIAFVLCFDTVRNVKRGEAIISSSSISAETATLTVIICVISISGIMNKNLHVHETLRCVDASQAQMLFDSVGWKYVVLGQHLIGHKVGDSAIQCIFYVLLRVFSQTGQESILLIGVCLQDGIQGFVVQAVRRHCAKHYYPRWTVSHLLDGDFVTANDQGYERKAPAQIQGGVEKFGSTLVSGLCGNLVCEGEMA